MYEFKKTVVKGFKDLLTLLISTAIMLFVVPVVEKAGIDIDVSVMTAGIVGLVFVGLRIARDWLKHKMGINWL